MRISASFLKDTKRRFLPDTLGLTDPDSAVTFPARTKHSFPLFNALRPFLPLLFFFLQLLDAGDQAALIDTSLATLYNIMLYNVGSGSFWESVTPCPL